MEETNRPKEAAEAALLPTGQYLTAVLLAVAPTALGSALKAMDPKKPNPTSDDWKTALQAGGDSGDVNAALLSILTSDILKPLITALRTPVPLLNNDVGHTPVLFSNGTPVVLDHVSIVRGIVLANGKSAKKILATPWDSGPPHPKGQDLLKLINLLSSFSETA